MEPKEKQYQKMVKLLLDGGYSDGDIKRLMKAEYHKGIDESQRQWWDRKSDEDKKERDRAWFKKSWFYGWPVIPTYDKLIKYILKEARCEEVKKDFEKVLKPNPKKSGPLTPYSIELAMSSAIEIALAFGYVIGELGEVTKREPFEYIKKIIQDEALLPYLPRERKAA